MPDPIELKHLETMQETAQYLRERFPGYGFTLLVFDLESTSGRMNYISNANRRDMLIALIEFVELAMQDQEPAP